MDFAVLLGALTADRFLRVLLLQDYNTRVVCLGTVLLGICAGVVGTFMLLRRRSLVGDVVGHSSLPGIAVAFIAMELRQPGSGRSIPGLLSGAAAAGLLGVMLTGLIGRFTRIKDDAALAIVLSAMYGAGIALFTVIQNMPTGNAAGLNHFILGWVALMTADDVRLFAAVTAIVLLVCGVLFKEFGLLCFDEEYAATQGWPVTGLDLLLMGLVVGVTVVGLQSVGLLLVVALPILPATAARFWTNHLGRMTLAAAALGGVMAWLGVVASALFPRLPAGPVIVLVGAVLFLGSLLFGAERGILRRTLLRWQTARRVGRHDLLRALYECTEAAEFFDGETDRQRTITKTPVPFASLLAKRSWPARRLRSLLGRAEREGLVVPSANDAWRLTAAGADAARRVVRNHRLWELYLITYADVATSRVDRDADLIEHVLEPELVAELEELLEQRAALPASPHG